MIEYRIRNNREFSEKMGELAAMLEHTRAITVKEIMDLRKRRIYHSKDFKSYKLWFPYRNYSDYWDTSLCFYKT
ncbi:hypothetical protein KR50_35860 [Jeotgalibacillus campisalis]|uniref:Uncharacterized protein n=1 Tax=Jeotgalibacillus campisalis TaxID=220754 RepID=A0A0C2VGP6_9BACL|nr:hypothetical protein KR50_35860 [Jeotgalibacillus campisalis]